MEIALGVLLVLVLLTVWANRINARYEKRREEASKTADARVASAWDAFGLHEEPEQAQAEFAALMRTVPLREIEKKSSLVSLAIMAIRAERYDALPETAARMNEVATACGETFALQGLAEAYAGDAERAKLLLQRARTGLAGCAGCSGDADGKILLQEVSIAIDALSDDAAHVAGSGAGPSLDPSERTAANYLALAAHFRDASRRREGDSVLAAPDEALAQADAWVDRDPASADAWLAKGVALARLGSLEVAERALGRALALDEGCHPAYLTLALLFRERAVGALSRLDSAARIALTDESLVARLATLVPQWAALAPREQAMLALAASPLGELLPTLVDDGVRLEIVPVHLRAQDLALAERVGEGVLLERYDELGLAVGTHRALLRWDALGDASPASPLVPALALGLLAGARLPATVRESLLALEGDLTESAALRFAAGCVERLKTDLGDLDADDPGRGAPSRALEALVARATAA